MKTFLSIKTQKEILSLIADINEHGDIKFNLEKLSKYVETLYKSEAYKKMELLERGNYDELQHSFNFECTTQNCAAKFNEDVEKLHIATNEGFIKFDTDDYDVCGGVIFRLTPNQKYHQTLYKPIHKRTAIPANIRLPSLHFLF